MALAIGVLAVLAPTNASQKQTTTPCVGGRYVITGNPRSKGKPTLKSGSITLRNATVSLSAGCPATLVRLKSLKGAAGGKGGMKGATRVRATWAQCVGVKGKVRLKAGIDSTCKRMWGTISTKRGKSRFDAELSLCGNGVVDSGEQCDGAACPNGYPCTDGCECDLDGTPGPGCTPGVDCPGDGGPHTSTTLVTGGGPGVTTTSVPGGSNTTTTISGGGSTSTTLPGDHFKCYKLRETGGGSFHPGPVSLVDQFGAVANVAKEATRFCNPADKEDEGINDPTAHLMCYDLANQEFTPQDHVVRNQFGDQILTVVRPDSLCVPAEKDGVQSALDLNHFKCYRVAQRHTKFAERIITVSDQFETKTTVVQKPLLMCNPVDKNGEGIVDPAGHLTCYRIIDAAGQAEFTPRNVSVEDQFTLQSVRAFRGTCRKASLLCVPSLKDPSNTSTTLPPTTTSTSSTTSTSAPSGSSSTTSTSSTSSTSAPGASSTTSTSSTSSTSAPGASSTSTSSTSSTSSSAPTPTTAQPTTSSSTSTSSTTSSTAGPQCCNGATNLRFLTANSPGDCGDVVDAMGVVVSNINCAGLYTGGGGNSVPLPYAVPDLGDSITAITSCSGSVATIGPTTSTDTGSKKNCTSPGCFFGAPLAVPNPGSTPTSVCVLNTLSEAPSGTADCSTGQTNLSAPLSSVLFLTGDTATDPSSTIPGIQPCPLCPTASPTCIGGPNNGMACTPGTTALNAAFPTSHDCPPDPMFNIGTLPVAFSLTTGTVTWNGTNPTNDTGSTVANQNRVFSGFCRDQDGTGAFEGTSPATAHECWRNNQAVGAACSGVFESCLQRNNGAFGPSGGNNRTIIAIGNSMSLAGGSAAATLVSVFTIRPTFDATVDAAGDLPGPGAVALPGTASLCNNAMCN